VLPNLPTLFVAVHVAERLLEDLERPIAVEGLALDLSGSIGIAVYPEDSDDVETLLRRADVAMYAAKEAGGGYELYAPELDQHSPQRLTLVSQVRPGLENREFVLHYQPKIRLSDGGHRRRGARALEPPRPRAPASGSVHPALERTVLLRPLTYYVLDHALRQWRTWSQRSIEVGVAVNLSPRSLFDLELPERVDEMLRRWSVPPAALTLELTENFLMADSGRSIGVLAELAEVGVRLSIDDFGTGYSSLSHLKRLPIAEIKIDRSFVMHMTQDANDAMIVGATIDLGRNLGLQVVAEGVEDGATADRLTDLECDLAQGYWFSRPVSGTNFTKHLEAERIRRSVSKPGREHLRAV
jgi:EAL domain-containing protein (putative c-di-GMP-specific phosphodiesterase class I)